MGFLKRKIIIIANNTSLNYLLFGLLTANKIDDNSFVLSVTTVSGNTDSP